MATCGAYLFSSTRRFMAAARKMIRENDRVRNEFYVCPIINHYIELYPENPVLAYRVNSMKGLGTPLDLKNYISGRPAVKNRGTWSYAG
jgi:hypothetical protein